MSIKNRISAIALCAAVSLAAVTGLSAGACAEWVETEDGFCYTDDETGEPLTRWQEIDGGTYYFGEDGIALTGRFRIGGKVYYFNSAKKGRMVTGWARIGKRYYHFGSDGVMDTGWAKIKGNTYYFGENGVMKAGGTYDIDGVSCTFAANGVLISPEPSEEETMLGFMSPETACELFGLTAEDCIARLPGDAEVISDDESGMSIAFTDMGIEGFNVMYMISGEEGLAVYSAAAPAGSVSVTDIAGMYADAGWSYEGAEEDMEVYVSPDGLTGAAISENDTEISLVVYLADFDFDSL